jgi:hypothetical protein
MESEQLREVLIFKKFKKLKVVIGLIVDDGVPSRGHRHNVFHDKYQLCGVASGYHKSDF